MSVFLAGVFFPVFFILTFVSMFGNIEINDKPISKFGRVIMFIISASGLLLMLMTAIH